jgi:hypothetical protein
VQLLHRPFVALSVPWMKRLSMIFLLWFVFLHLALSVCLAAASSPEGRAKFGVVYKFLILSHGQRDTSFFHIHLFYPNGDHIPHGENLRGVF